jgi:hypothetical protein
MSGKNIKCYTSSIGCTENNEDRVVAKTHKTWHIELFSFSLFLPICYTMVYGKLRHVLFTVLSNYFEMN